MSSEDAPPSAGLVKARVLERELSLSAQAIALRSRGAVEKHESALPPRTSLPGGTALPPAEAVAVDLSTKAERFFTIHPFNPAVVDRVLFVHVRQLEEVRAFLGSGHLRADVLLCTHSSRAQPSLIVGALRNQFRLLSQADGKRSAGSGSLSLRCAATFYRGSRGVVREWTLQLAFALRNEEVLSPSASLHVFSCDLWDRVGEQRQGPLVKEGDETSLLTRLEAALGDREVCVGRGTPLSPTFSLLSLDGKEIKVEGLYFDPRSRGVWHYRRPEADDSELYASEIAAGAKSQQDTADVLQTVRTYLTELPALYAIMVGSFLMIFVPSEGIHCVTFRSDCSLYERMGLDSIFSRFALYCNVSCCAGAAFTNMIAGRRELWMIKFLDVDPAFPQTHLSTVIDRYPSIKEGFRFWNRWLRRLSTTTLLQVVGNFAVSLAWVVRRIYADATVCCPDVSDKSVKALAVLISSTLLVITTLIRQVNTSRLSKATSLGISSMQLIPLCYNQIDHDHINDAVPLDPSDAALPSPPPPSSPPSRAASFSARASPPSAQSSRRMIRPCVN